MEILKTHIEIIPETARPFNSFFLYPYSDQAGGGGIWPPYLDIYIFGPFMVKIERLFLSIPKAILGQ